MRPLISAAELAANLDGLRLVDARGGGRAAHASAHLPGAVFTDLERDLATPGDFSRGGRHPLPDLRAWCATLGRWGIEPRTRVVVYDAAGGANAAARCWWMMRAVGHEPVAVLDGGMEAAVRAGVQPTAETPAIEPMPPYPLAAGAGWSLPLAGADEVEARRLDPDHLLVDVRAGFRYRGESDPFDPLPGHIPGARNFPYAECLDAEGRFRPAGELRDRFERALAGLPPQAATVYCGSGVTACHTLLALAHAGLDGASLYVGSWSEWCRSDRPRASIVSE